MSVFGNENGVFPLGGGLAVFGAGGPVVFGVDDRIAYAGVDHRFDGEDHARGHRDFAVVEMMEDVRSFMEGKADAVAYKLIDDRAFMLFCNFFYSSSIRSWKIKITTSSLKTARYLQ